MTDQTIRAAFPGATEKERQKLGSIAKERGLEPIGKVPIIIEITINENAYSEEDINTLLIYAAEIERESKTLDKWKN